MYSKLREKTQETICALYQNREQEAIQQVAALLPEYQKIIQMMLPVWKEEQAVYFFGNLKRLVENYQAQDMLGMADCMEEFALPMILLCEEGKA